MQGKGIVKFFAIMLAIVCLYQLSFTWVTRKVENDAETYAKGNPAKERAYLDSISNKPVYPVFKYTYQFCKNNELSLGLDLKGGMNVTMQIAMNELIKSLSNNNPDPDFNKALSAATLEARTNPDNYINIFVAQYKKISPDGKLAPIFATKENEGQLKFNASNSEVESFLKKQANTAVSQAFNILRTRIDKFGVVSPNMQLQEGTNRILIEMPGVTDKERVSKLLEGSAKLEFYQTFENQEIFGVLNNINSLIAAKKKSEKDTTATATTAAPAKADSAKGGSLLSKVQKNTGKDTANLAGKTRSAFEAQNPFFAKLPPQLANQNGQQAMLPGPVVGRARQTDTAAVNAMLNLPEVKAMLPQNLKLVWGIKAATADKVFELFALKLSGANNGAALTGDVITEARSDVDQMKGGNEVTMAMNSQGAEAWARITAEAAGKPNDESDNRAVAIVLDDNVVSAPRVGSEISGGRSSISGNFTKEETEDLANILKAGRLPAPAKIVQTAVVGPSLGEEAINHGLASCVAGLAVVLIFMVAYYNRGGTVAVVAVIVNVFFLMGVLTSIHAVLTLPGIAGIVLTLGIAVDANVLVYERVREELGHGKSLRVAIADGFKHALWSILDSQISTFLTALILAVFGSGPIRGFATTLMIGILTSLFCSLLISRVIFEWMLEKGWDIKFSNPWSSHTFKNANYAFVKNRAKFYIFSGLFIGAGIISMATRGFNYGVDFQGGHTYTVTFNKNVNSQDVREAADKAFGFGKTEVKTYGQDNRVQLTTNYNVEDNSAEADKAVETAVRKVLAGVNPNYTIDAQQKVTPTIANDLKTSAVWTVIFAILVISAYILIRFRKWQFSLGAMVATAHDALLVLSFFTLFKDVLPFSLDIDQAFIAAILTVIGYSINDTVVVFDRIREHLRLNAGKNTDTKEVINHAINSTLSRTIITALTVIFVLVVLFVFGGAVLRGFSFALLIGVCFGTYSSICVATPVIVDFGKKDLK